MKKIIILLLVLLGIIIICAFALYYEYSAQINQIKAVNQEYERYYKKEIQGNEIVSIINKIVDSNEKIQLAKDKNGNYIDNNQNSILAEIYFADNKKTYKIETLVAGGIEKFSQYYSSQKFKCSKIEYHTDTKLVKYLYFEQIE